MNWVKYMFSIGKNEILNPLEILLIPQGFDLWKGPANSLTPLFPKLIMQISTQTDNHKYRKVLQLKKVLLKKMSLKFQNPKFTILCKTAFVFFVKWQPLGLQRSRSLWNK